MSHESIIKTFDIHGCSVVWDYTRSGFIYLDKPFYIDKATKIHGNQVFRCIWSFLLTEQHTEMKELSIFAKDCAKVMDKADKKLKRGTVWLQKI